MTARPVRLAVLGDPIDHSRSPDLHRAGLAAVGLVADSCALRTPVAALGARLRELADQDFRGVNLTTPLKEAALDHVARVSDAARRARSVNTIGFDPEGGWGDTTDGGGFVDLLRVLGRRPRAQRVVLLGGGGAARSLALAAMEAGAEVTAIVRRPDAARESWRDLASASLVAWGSDAAAESLARATVLVNATPADDGLPCAEAPRALILDLRYGPHPTAWVAAARAGGREAYDGLGLLVFQARRSLSRWTGTEVPVDPLARAVGWPR